MERYALLSVYHKAGIVKFAQELVELGWQLIASGGTAKTLAAEGVKVRDVADFVGEPILGHRVVTLSREVHAAILARDTPEDQAELAAIGMPRIDLVCVDLYPLIEAIKAGKSEDEIIELTDIGGPTMLRAAAKGGRITIADAADRERVLEWLRDGEMDRPQMIRALRAKAEFVCARYIAASAEYHGLGEYAALFGRRVYNCKYGENPYQTSTFYTTDSDDPLAIPNFKQLDGQPPSHINVTDLDRSLTTTVQIAAGFDANGWDRPYVGLIVKHGNATGAAFHGQDPEEVIRRVVDGNPGDAFGGIAMFNFEITLPIANLLKRYRIPEGAPARPLDGVAAPGFAPEAIDRLQRKDDKCRIFVNPALAELTRDSLKTGQVFRHLRGGFLVQSAPEFVLDLKDERVTRHGDLDLDSRQDVVLCWGVGSTENSNTIVLGGAGMTLAVAVGQQSRVGSAKLALERARAADHAEVITDYPVLAPASVVAYSDSFFPFPDGPMVLAKAGVKAIFATSGSIRDGEVLQALTESGTSLWTIPDKDGRGFFGH